MNTFGRALGSLGFYVILGTAHAIPFDSSMGGQVVATVNAGGGADYSSLHDAAVVFDAVPNGEGIRRPWILEIQSSLVEPNNACFGNMFSSTASLTIRPAPGTTPVVTFTSTFATGGTSGHLLFGGSFDAQLTTPSAANCFPSNRNFVLDGSNTPGGSTRDLTLRYVGASPLNHVVAVIGNTWGMVIKNLNVDFQDTAGSYACIGLLAGTLPEPLVNLKPDATLIVNCFLSARGTGPSGFGVTGLATGFGSPTLPLTSGFAIDGTEIRNCTMEVNQRGVFMNGWGDATIENNRISLTGSEPGYSYQGIFHYSSNNAMNRTFIARSNRIDFTSLTLPITGQDIDGIRSDGTVHTANILITNNTISNLRSPAGSPNDVDIWGIEANSPNSFYRIEHNTIDIATTGAAHSGAGGIVKRLNPTTGDLKIINNIVRFDVPGLSTCCIAFPNGTNVICTGNTLFRGTGTAFTGRIYNLSAYATMSQWQAHGYDLPASGGQSVDPKLTFPSWDNDHHFAFRPIQGMASVESSSVLTDIDGNARPATGAIPGADEPAIDCSSAGNPSLDCNNNGQLDSCEIALNPELDCNGDAELDSCQSPCVFACSDDFTSAPTTWLPMANQVEGYAITKYNAGAGAFLATLYASADRYRATGVFENSSNCLLYQAVGTANYVRGKFYVYRGGQSGNAQNTVPMLRMRLANRFAVNSMLEVNSHVDSDPQGTALAADVMPSADPIRPSLYRVDFDPVDVPALQGSGDAGKLLRGFEAFATAPQDNGYLALTEIAVCVYPASALPPAQTPDQVLTAGTTDAGSLAVRDPATDLMLDSYDTSGPADSLVPRPTYSEGPEGVTLDTSLVPAEYLGIAARDFNPGSETTYSQRLRAEPCRIYKVRFHATSTQQTNLNAHLRLRARTIRFFWTQKLEMGGAYAAGDLTNQIAREAMPGIGCLNPDRNGSENGGWYTVLMNTPFSGDIRSEFPPDAALALRMPNLTREPGPGISEPSLLDIRFGIDVIDTQDNDYRSPLEKGNMTVDRIEARSYTQVAD